MNKRIFSITIISIIINLQIIGQTKSIILFDSINEIPISFATITNSINSTFYISDKKGKINFVKEEPFDMIWEIRHLSYENSKINTSDLINKDTIFLYPKLYKLDIISITASTIIKHDYFSTLNKIIKEYKKKKKVSTFKYAYYLESTINNKIVEKIMSQITVSYSPRIGFSLPNNHVDFGDFWYTKKAPFLNLQTEKFLLEFDLFSRKKKMNKYFLPSNSKIKSKYHELIILPCSSCQTSEKKIQLTSKDKKLVSTFYVDIINNSIREVNYIMTLPKHLNLFRIGNNESLNINEIRLNYLLNNNQEINLLNFSIDLIIDDSLVVVKGFFKKLSSLDTNNTLHIVMGNYNADNIYEQILLFPVVDKTRIRNIFNYKSYAEFNILDTIGLSSSNNEFRTQFLSSSIGSNKFKFWSKNRLEIEDINLKITGKKIEISPFNKVIPIKNNFSLFWVIDIVKENNTIKFKSLPSLFNLNKTIIANEYLDTLDILLKTNLAFDLFEISRLELIDSLNNSNIVDSTLVSIQRCINNVYSNKYKMISEFLDNHIRKQIDPISLITLDSIITKNLKINNIDWYFDIEFSKILKDPKYFSIMDRIIKYGLRYKELNIRKSDLCLNRGIDLLNRGVKYFNNIEGFDQRRLGSFYAQLANLYIEIGDEYNACHCISQVKLLWPKGFLYGMQNIWKNIPCN